MNVQKPSGSSRTSANTYAVDGYMSGFGNGFETEALPGALPIGRNSPQKCAYGLYAEQMSGSPFTAPRVTNERSWLYRIRPTIAHWQHFKKADNGLWRTAPCKEVDVPIGPLRWDPTPVPDKKLNFVEGIHTMATSGDAAAQTGMGTHIYVATRSMQDEYLANCDGEMLIVPEMNCLRIATEYGVIDIEPGEIAVIPRGIKMRVELPEGVARGYICENYGGALTIPERGPIGANCMSNPRDFLTPVAAYEDVDTPSRMTVKWGGQLWSAEFKHSPLDVVAWHGNYYPYKYDLRRYSPVGPVLFDHADPSIFTVLTSPSETPGTANIDFVIFSDRWLVGEDTFRPPWYHLNVMSEFMGLVYGVYDAKTGGGFQPGGASLHNTMLPHGPDKDAFLRGSNEEMKPHKIEGTMAFLFETRFMQNVTKYALEVGLIQDDYKRYGKDLPKFFDPSKP
ncbi:homogentisate 1,2-dioxygenase [Roseovarius litoreus]|uniref:Homogentisate 1,2-dioxygenase n=2 Tax=Roseovarius litoreus TaxID=1155722 RepID=A0A1M7JG27_9RHOB|nr:homogentisate 1,2-dioxygenase [Roseovarius litoreus]SHM51906.1 homogentisate 1,2-dioxygenase [Roseovarius litoreus]